MYGKAPPEIDSVSAREKPNLVSFIVITTIAVPLLAAGIIGLTAPELLPWPPNPTIAWSLLGVGGVMDIAAVFTLMSELQRVRAR